MPAPTNSQKIEDLRRNQADTERELAVFVSTQKIRQENLEKLMLDQTVTITKLQERLVDLATKITSLEERCKALELGSSRSWQVWLALLGASLALLVALLKK
jgi:hypothetical protein